MCQFKTRAPARKTLVALIIMLVATSAFSLEQASENTLMVADPFVQVLLACGDDTATLFTHPDFSWRGDTLFDQCQWRSACMCEQSALACKHSVAICDGLTPSEDECPRIHTLLSSYDSPSAGYARCREDDWEEDSPCCCNFFHSLCF